MPGTWNYAFQAPGPSLTISIQGLPINNRRYIPGLNADNELDNSALEIRVARVDWLCLTKAPAKPESVAAFMNGSSAPNRDC